MHNLSDIEGDQNNDMLCEMEEIGNVKISTYILMSYMQFFTSFLAKYIKNEYII